MSFDGDEVWGVSNYVVSLCGKAIIKSDVVFSFIFFFPLLIIIYIYIYKISDE